MNNFCITGRLVADPVLRGQDGKQVASFRVAVNRSYHREGQPTADFFQASAFGKTAEFITKYFLKGNMIAITGELRIEEYTSREGEKRSQPTIYVNTADFCGDRNNGGQQTMPAQQKTDDFVPVNGSGEDRDIPF